MNITCTVNLATFLFFALSLVVKSGYGYGAALLLILAIIILAREQKNLRARRDLHAIALLLLLAALFGAFDAWRSHLLLRDYELPGKYLLVPVILYALAIRPPDARAIWLGAATGALLGATSAWYYSQYTPELLAMGRGARYLHPIQFGNIAAVLAVLSACGLREVKGLPVRLYLGAGIAAGLYAMLLSETRGSLLALLLLGIILLWQGRRHVNGRFWLATLAAFAMLWWAGGETLSRRFADIRNDLVHYQQGHSATSIGARLELWQFALQEGARHPLLGAGTAGFRHDKTAWLHDHPAREFIGELGHVHNEYLDAFARRGATGLALVLALIIVPLVAYRRLPPSAARTAGIAHLVLYGGFGLTQTALFGHNSGMLFFALPLCLLYSAACRPREKAA
ncbi:MAG: O-antigen ligase family protein [Cardiobacteriaceae bacterium]|nr:O-antigen ligase family protein [Cardiobacteriaceae bacterium]